MPLQLSAILNGVSALACLVVGVAFGIRFVLLYSEHRKPLMPFIALTATTAGLLFLGTVTSFFSLVFTGANIDPQLYGVLSYVSAPISATSALYVGYSIFDPDHKRLVLYLYGAVSVVCEVALLGFPDMMVSGSTPGPGELTDVSLESLVLGIIGFFIVSLLFILPRGFLVLRKKLEGAERQHATYLVFGWVTFAIAAVLDAMVPTVYVQLIVVARVLMVVGFTLIFTGFAPPKTDFDRPRKLDKDDVP